MNRSHANDAVAHGLGSPSNSRKNLQASHSGNLFESFNDENLLRELLIDSIRKCKKSRDEIADQMSQLLQTRLTRRALDLYTAESAEQNRFPMQYARAFATVTGDDRILRTFAEMAGLQVIGKEEQDLLELGRAFLKQKRANAMMRDLEIRLEGTVL